MTEATGVGIARLEPKEPEIVDELEDDDGDDPQDIVVVLTGGAFVNALDQRSISEITKLAAMLRDHGFLMLESGAFWGPDIIAIFEPVEEDESTATEVLEPFKGGFKFGG